MAEELPNPQRRRLIQAAAAAPLVPRLARAGDRPRVAVVGAGAFGGWTAHHLNAAGADVVLLDAWGPGNARASSGGESRVIRAVYGADRIYSEMVRRAYELWEVLDAGTDETLYTETGALWMLREEDSTYLRAALPILSELGFPVDEPTLAEAAARWPQISFKGIRKLYLERRAGALAARRCCQAVVDRAVRSGVDYRVAAAGAISGEGERLGALRLADGSSLAADAYVFCAGPWLGELFPDVLGDAIRPTRQPIFYFGTPPGDAGFRPPAMPVWIDFGERIHYGLPDLRERGFKLADDTRGEQVDPTTMDRRPTRKELARARAFLAERFPTLADAPLVESRVCQYENSPDGDLIVDRHPALDNVWLAGGGSGHGFKLSPALGEMLAHGVLEGTPLPQAFAISRLDGDRPAGTQFER